MIEPYLFFEGRAEEAIEFYRKAVGAEVEFQMRYGESPEPDTHAPPNSENKIMHASIRIGGSRVMLSDGFCKGATKFEGFSLSIAANDASQCEKLFTALSEGGKVDVPLTKTFFSPSFGMLTDCFGVHWMVLVAQQQK